MTQTAESPGLLTPGDSQTTSAPASPVADSDESNAPLRLVDLLDVLGYRDDESISICHQKPGGVFRGSVMPTGIAPRFAGELGDGVCMWFGVNPTSATSVDKGRGTTKQTTRLADLCTDVDVKPGACRDLAHAEQIIDEITTEFGMEPTIVVYSGHGLQAHWAISGGDITPEFTIDSALSLSRRFGRLVAAVADEHGANLDKVSDLARVMRVPGSVNHKGTPVPVTGYRGAGGPLTVADASQRLDDLGIHHQADDTSSDEQQSNPNGWTFADRTCNYVATWLDKIASDGPRGPDRNPWLCSQAVRLCCAWRLGCITEADFRHARAQLEARMVVVVARTTPQRTLKRCEMTDAYRLGRRRASCKTEAEARAELGTHEHMVGGTFDDFFGTKAATPGVVDATAPTVPWVPLYASQLLTRSALRSLPKPEPLIDGVLDKGTCALLYGYRGSLKSFIALDWAASVASGRPWQGRRTDSTRALYIAAEGAHGYPGRFDAWETGWRQPITDGQLDLYPRPVNLMDRIQVGELGALIDWGGYGFVVIDTLARCTVGGEENSAKDMGLVVDHLYYLLDRTPDRRGVVTAVHHTGKDQKTLRGSSAIEAGVDTVYSTNRDGPVVTLNREKRKDGPELDSHLLALDSIPGTDSCCIKAVSSVPTASGTDESTAKLRLIVSQHFVPTGATGATLRDFAVSEGGMSKSSFYRAVAELVKVGYLVKSGADTRPFYMVNHE